MKEGIKCIKDALNQCILFTDCINNNVKHEVTKYWNVRFKKGLRRLPLNFLKHKRIPYHAKILNC